MRKNLKYILALFIGIAITKIFLSFFISGPVIFTDEICVLLRGEYFAKSLKMVDCTEVITFPAGNPMPFYSILISPLYLFFDAMQSYRGALIINSILMASLVFPLFHLFLKVTKKPWIILPSITLLLFSPAVFLYEKLVMTEALFIVLNIWFAYFYLKSFEENKTRNKVIALILSLLSAITRPFGFITILAMMINELAVSKRKKATIPVFLIVLGLIFILLPFQLPNIWSQIWTKFLTLIETNNFLLGLTAVKNEANSFIVTTYLIPMVFFFGYIFRKSNEFAKISAFLISFIIFNFIVSTQHLYGYLLEGNYISFLTRYINMSVVFILVFGAIFFFREKHFKWTKGRIIMTAALFIPLLFFVHSPVKHSLNMDISQYYYTGVGYIVSRGFLMPYFIPICITFLLLLIFHKKRTLAILLAATFMINSIAIHIWEQNFAGREYDDLSWELFRDTKLKILFIQTPLNPTLTYGKLLTLTNNEVDITFQPYVTLTAVQDYDYLVSTAEVPLEFVGVTNYAESIYPVPK